MSAKSRLPASGEALSLPALIVRLKDLQSLRRLAIKQQCRGDRAIEDLIVNQMLTDVEETREAKFLKAKQIRQAAERAARGLNGKGRGQTRTDNRLIAAPPFILYAILANKLSRGPYDTLRQNAEREMAKLAVGLPVVEWSKTVPALSLQSLAVLIAEIGTGWNGNGLGDFATEARVWKRLGLAVINGKRQQRMRDKALALEHLYSPSRRAEVWTVCSLGIFPHLHGHPYRAVYDKRRVHTAQRVETTKHLPYGHPDKWTLKRCDDDGRRIMTKALISDLRKAWHQSLAVRREAA